MRQDMCQKAPCYFIASSMRLRCGLDNRSSIPDRSRNVSDRHHVQIDSGVGPFGYPNQWAPGASSSELKWSEREADYSPLSSAEVKNAWSWTSTPAYVLMLRCLIKYQGQLYLYLTEHLRVFTNKSLATESWWYEHYILYRGNYFTSSHACLILVSGVGLICFMPLRSQITSRIESIFNALETDLEA
jgi:hypothetical protein